MGCAAPLTRRYLIQTAVGELLGKRVPSTILVEFEVPSGQLEQRIILEEQGKEEIRDEKRIIRKTSEGQVGVDLHTHK